MTGFLGQRFDFAGEDGGWYSLIADPLGMHVNMRVTSPVVDVPETTYITGTRSIPPPPSCLLPRSNRLCMYDDAVGWVSFSSIEGGRNTDVDGANLRVTHIYMGILSMNTQPPPGWMDYKSITVPSFFLTAVCMEKQNVNICANGVSKYKLRCPPLSL